MRAPSQVAPLGRARYRPPLLLRHAHLQSALASSSMRRRRVERAARPLAAASEDLVVPCRDGIRLLAHHTPPRSGRDDAPLAILLHGWEGSAHSLHILSAALGLWAEGYRVVRINLRDHGDSHHLNRGIFHSCLLDEVADAVSWVGRQWPAGAAHLAGFSLGGNFALRIAAGTEAGMRLRRVAAVCPVLDPAETMDALDGGSPIYRLYFLRRWRRSLQKKAALFPDLYDFGRLDRFRRLRDMTDYFVRRYTPFADLESYLAGYTVTGERLRALAVPTRLLMSEDDPVIPVGAVGRLARTPLLAVDRSRFGGHCGFVTDWRLGTWVDDYLVGAFR